MAIRNEVYGQFGKAPREIASYTTGVGVREMAKSYFHDAIDDGVPFNARYLNQISRQVAAEEFKKAGVKEIKQIVLQTPILDDLIAAKFVGRPCFDDVTDGAPAVIESMAKAEEALAKAIGASHLKIVGSESTDAAGDGGEFGKTVTSNSQFIHAVADYDIGILFRRPYPFQAMLPSEAVRGKDVMWDVIPPYGLGSAYFGVEDPTLTESDFPQYTRNDVVKFMYTVGRITDAAYRLGLSAYPARDFMSLSVDTHQDAIRSLRERALLGVNRDTRSITNEYIAPNDYEYEGIHFKVAASTGKYQTWTDGSSVSGDTIQDTYDNLDTALNNSAIKMAVMNAVPNVMLCDPNTFAIVRKGLMKTQYGVPPTVDYSFGISSITYSLQDMPALKLISHPFLPRTSGQSACYLLDTRLMARRVAWTDTMELLAKVNPSQKFYISASETFIDKSDIDGKSSLQGGVLNITHGMS